ncbi:uncharacterized protein LOC143022858 [Oratosquilla oratoria]|uniref:uncharacterized protein LOC143022858 n=1 Tax=Oratosquilla oratoria TaxID=337810 RepID=UPI003F75CCD8
MVTPLTLQVNELKEQVQEADRHNFSRWQRSRSRPRSRSTDRTPARRTLEVHTVRPSRSQLLYIRDPLTRHLFLIDTVAAVSILPASPSSRMLPPLTSLYAANKTKIDIFRKTNLTLSLNLRRAFEWAFYVADVSQPILGADFLNHYGLFVDIQRRRLYDVSTRLSSCGHNRPGVSTSISVTSQDTPFASHSATSLHTADTSPRRASHRHFWPPNPRQATTSCTRTTTHRQDRVRVPYAPGDHSAQQQQLIPVHPDDIPKTAITTPFGLYEYVRMPFGLKNAAQTFQRFIDEVLRGLPFCFASTDDLLFASPDEATHRRHLEEVQREL